MIVPHTDLSAETLQALLEDFVTRDGTDYGWEELSMQDKSARLLAQLESGKLLISYNEETHSCGLVTKEALVKIVE